MLLNFVMFCVGGKIGRVVFLPGFESFLSYLILGRSRGQELLLLGEREFSLGRLAKSRLAIRLDQRLFDNLLGEAVDAILARAGCTARLVHVLHLKTGGALQEWCLL